MIPGSLAMQAAAAPAAPTFDPATLFSSGEKGFWYDASLWATTVWQNSTRTTQVTAAGQSIGGVTDLSGRSNHLAQATAASQPTLEISGGIAGILGDGTNDLMTGPSILNAINSNVFEVFVVFRYNSVSTNSANPYNNAAILSDSNGQFEAAFARTTGVFGIGGGASAEVNVTTAGSLTARHVLHGRLDSGNLVVSLNGGAESQVSCTNFNGLGPIQILKSWGSSGFANGRLHEAIVRGTAMTGTQRTDCINYLKSKWSVA